MTTRPLAMLLALALLACFGTRHATAAFTQFTPTSAFPNRYARNYCSLIASTATDTVGASCQIDSQYGTSRGVVSMAFGEQACTVTLTGCVPGVCYSFRDHTNTVERDQVSRPTGGSGLSASLFKSISATGVSEYAHTNEGFSFTPSSSTVVISYETHSCYDYYSYRGRTEKQQCGEAIGAITEIDSGTPFSLSC